MGTMWANDREFLGLGPLQGSQQFGCDSIGGMEVRLIESRGHLLIA